MLPGLSNRDRFQFFARHDGLARSSEKTRFTPLLHEDPDTDRVFMEGKSLILVAPGTELDAVTDANRR